MMVIKNRFAPLLVRNRAILTNAISLIGTLIVTSGLGFAFWWLVARRFDLASAGLASALISAMYLLGTFGMLGLGTLLIGELARHPQMKTSLIATALLIAGVGSAILGIGFALIAGHFSSEFAPLISSWGITLLFAFGVAITGLTLVLDQAMLGLLRGNIQLWRNAIFASSKLLLLLPVGYYFSSKGAMAIYATWLAGNLLSLGFLMLLLWRSHMGRLNLQFQWAAFWRMRNTATAHHILNLSLQAAQFAIPVIVALILTPEINASFYVAWLMVTSFFVIPSSLTQSLYAVSAGDASALAERARFTLRTSFIGVLAGGVVSILLARIILGFFNPAYAVTATDSLRIMLLAALPVVIRVHYVAIHQIKRQIKPAAIKFFFLAIMELTFAIMGGKYGGLVGLSIGWVLAMYIEGALMFSTVYRTAFREAQSTTPVNNSLAEESQ
jgi:O-antigen/teichoic acid export membrane protein